MVETLKKNWLLILILLVGAFMRLYKIDQYMTFLGDEGRDVIIVRNLLVKADPILIGPGTSVGNMYLGPLYYYLIAIPLLLANFSPIGPAIFVALLGVITIYLVYLVGFEWFSKRAGLVASLLFAISPTVIIYSHSSWNPNIMPFFALLSVYSIWRVWKNPPKGEVNNYKWLLVCAASLAFVFQSHYLGVLITPVLLVYWFLARVPKRYSLISIFLFLFLMSPLLIFDIRHNWMNSKALYTFLTVKEETAISINPLSVVSRSYPIFEQINASMITAKNVIFGKIITILIIIYFIFSKVRNKKILVLWLISGLIGLSLYKLEMYDHYFGFLFPLPFLLVGALLSKLYENKYKISSILLFSTILFVNIYNNPFKNNPNNQLQRAKNVATKIINESKNTDFNFAVIADRNYEDGYQYFLEKEESRLVEIDSQIEESVKEQLFVICEMEKTKCDPTHSPKAEVANFGWSKIDSEFEVDGVIIYKLIHAK